MSNTEITLGGATVKTYIAEWQNDPDYFDLMNQARVYYVEKLGASQSHFPDFLEAVPSRNFVRRQRSLKRATEYRPILGVLFSDQSTAYSTQMARHGDFVEAETRNDGENLAQYLIHKGTDELDSLHIQIYTWDMAKTFGLTDFLLGKHVPDQASLKILEMNKLFSTQRRAQIVDFNGSVGRFRALRTAGLPLPLLKISQL